jgi:hypothetical protein
VADGSLTREKDRSKTGCGHGRKQSAETKTGAEQEDPIQISQTNPAKSIKHNHERKNFFSIKPNKFYNYGGYRPSFIF